MNIKSSKHIPIIKLRETYNDSQMSNEGNKYLYYYLSMNKKDQFGAGTFVAALICKEILQTILWIYSIEKKIIWGISRTQLVYKMACLNTHRGETRFFGSTHLYYYNHQERDSDFSFLVPDSNQKKIILFIIHIINSSFITKSISNI